MSAYDSDESSFSHPSSFSDQSFKVSMGTTLHSSRDSVDSENNGKACKTIARDALGDTGMPKEGYLSTIFSCNLFQKDIHAGKVVTYPKCMRRMLSSMYPEILSVLEETYGLGAFIFVGGSFQCLFPRHPQRFHKIKTELICDMCIFANNKPAILLTVAKNKKQGDHLTGYNLQMKRNLEEWISKTLVEFKALSVVVTPDDFKIREHFKRIIFNVETQSMTKVLPTTLATVLLTMETFFRKLATCKFVQRFYGVSEETVYLDQDLFEEFIELMEEKNTKTVYSKCSDYIMLLACELGYRLALIGHTSIYSRSEEKREFEELRKAQNLSISINYDRSVADENLEEGDVLLSSWKGGTILFRAGIAAARRTLASAVVNRSAKVQDEERRNRLMDLVCLHMKRAEEQLEKALRRADSKSQIAELESFNIHSRDEETQMYPVGTDAVSRSPTPEILGSSSEDSTVQEDLDSQYTDSQTSESSNSRQMAKKEEATYAEYPLAHFDHKTPSKSPQGDEATCIPSARLGKPRFSHSEETMQNINTVDWTAGKRVKDQFHLRKRLRTPELNIERKTVGNISHISTENQPTHRSDPTNPHLINRLVSEGTHQSKQTSSKQNKIPPENRYTTLESEQLLNEERFLSHQIYTSLTVFKQQSRQPTEVSEVANHNEPRPSHYSNNAETRHDEKGTNNTTRPLQDQNNIRGSSALSDSHNTNTSEQRPSPSHQHRDPANTPYTTLHNTPTRDRSTNTSEQKPSPSNQHRDPANTPYITNQDASTRHKGFPKHNRNAGNESHITPKGGQSRLTYEGKPNASGDSIMTSPSLEDLSAIPKGIVKRRRIAFE